jgi:transposase
VPPIQPHVTEYRLHAVCCPHCQQQVRATLPESVPTGAFGPRVTALIALLHGRYRLVDVLADEVDVDISLGSVAASCERVSTALEPVYAAVMVTLPQQAHINVDETRWQEAGQRCWLWVVVSAVGIVCITYLHACDETAFTSPIWLLSLLSRPDERTRAGLFRTVGWCGSYL